MLTAQKAAPSPALQPFVQWYVQRETAANCSEIVEPVLPRGGPMLEFSLTPSTTLGRLERNGYDLPGRQPSSVRSMPSECV